MSITRFFDKELNAPLKNSRWSWGAVSVSGGAVYLRVWADEFETRDAKRWARLTRRAAFVDRPNHPGWLERKEHVLMVVEGAKSYAVVCRAKHPSGSPRQIASFNKKQVLVGGAVRTDCCGDHWLEIVDRRKM